ncbi:MAG: DUF4258 domain-containing protein [Nitrososphaerales archaeon]
MSRIIFSKHVLRRARERGIDDKDIISTIEEPAEVINVKYGRKGTFRHLECNYVVAIYEVRNGEIVVVTSVKVDKRRLERYGFSRI